MPSNYTCVTTNTFPLVNVEYQTTRILTNIVKLWHLCWMSLVKRSSLVHLKETLINNNISLALGQTCNILHASLSEGRKILVLNCLLPFKYSGLGSYSTGASNAMWCRGKEHLPGRPHWEHSLLNHGVLIVGANILIRTLIQCKDGHATNPYTLVNIPYSDCYYWCFAHSEKWT